MKISAAAATVAAFSALHISVYAQVNKADFPANHPFNTEFDPIKVEYLFEIDPIGPPTPGEPYEPPKVRTSGFDLAPLRPAYSKEVTGVQEDAMRIEHRFNKGFTLNSPVVTNGPVGWTLFQCGFRTTPYADNAADDILYKPHESDDDKNYLALNFEQRFDTVVLVFGIECFVAWHDLQL